MVIFSKMNNTITLGFNDTLLDSENYKKACADENRKASQKLLKNFCQVKQNSSETYNFYNIKEEERNYFSTQSLPFTRQISSYQQQPILPVSLNNNLPEKSDSFNTISLSTKTTTFPILQNNPINYTQDSIIDYAIPYTKSPQTTFYSYNNISTPTSLNNNNNNLNSQQILLLSKRSNNNFEENSHILRPVIQSPFNMLHRSPSGAARRIRQRREENSQRQFPILSSPNSPATFNKSPSNETSKETMIDGDNNTTNESLQMDYRDLMNSSSYKSILPDDDFNISYSRPPQRILCNSTSISPHASKMESSTEESLQPEITSFSNGSQQYPEVNQHTITMESNKFLDKVDFSTLLSSTSNVIPPIPPKRSSLASSFGDTSSHTSITNNNKPLNQKPTIQVHPMPAPRKHSLRCDDSSDEISPSSTLEKNYKKIPPPIPKKPAKFMFKTNNDSPILFNPSEPYYHIHSVSSPVPPSPVPRSADPYKEHSVMRQRFDSLPSLGSSQPQGNNKENERNNECETKESTYNNLFVKNQSSYLLSASTSNLFSSNLLSSSISSAQSTESLNQLFTSPSMLSLQNAYKNCQLMNEQELETLEEKRKGLIESLSRKIRVLDQEKIMIDEDIIENENFKMLLFKKIDLDPQMLIRLNNHISQAKTLILLESKVNLQLEKLENYLINNNDTMEPSIYEFCQFRKNRLIEQLSDSSMLRNLHRSRDVEIENILSSKYFLQDQMKEWRFYKDSLVRLLTEKRQMEDRLSQARHQLAALDSLSIQADALMKSLSITNNHTRDISSDGSSSMISDHSGGNTLDRRDINVDELRNDNTISNSNNSTTVTV